MDKSVLIEEGSFYLDDTMEEYKDLLKGVPDSIIEKWWKWIYDKFYGKELSVSFIRERIIQFKKGLK